MTEEEIKKEFPIGSKIIYNGKAHNINFPKDKIGEVIGYDYHDQKFYLLCAKWLDSDTKYHYNPKYFTFVEEKEEEEMEKIENGEEQTLKEFKEKFPIGKKFIYKGAAELYNNRIFEIKSHIKNSIGEYLLDVVDYKGQEYKLSPHCFFPIPGTKDYKITISVCVATGEEKIKYNLLINENNADDAIILGCQNVINKTNRMRELNNSLEIIFDGTEDVAKKALELLEEKKKIDKEVDEILECLGYQGEK